MKAPHLTAAFAIVVGLTLSSVPAVAQAQKLTIESTMAELLDNPQAKAVLTKYLPDMVSNPQIDMARSMSLHSLQAYAPDLTDEKLAQINADLTDIK